MVTPTPISIDQPPISMAASLPLTLLGVKVKVGGLNEDTYRGGKDDCELPTTKALLAKEELSLNQAVITNDALGTQKTAF